ncbi:MAG: hypothetical protein V3S48_01185 [Candidatus Neomarinimicrobiota bacterium]
MKKQGLGIIIVILVVGTMLGTLLGEMLGFILPEGVVKDFFLTSIHFDLGGLAGKEDGVINLNLIMVQLKFGLSFTLNFSSLLGISGSYYFLRYFR